MAEHQARTKGLFVTLLLIIIGLALSPVVGSFAAQAVGNSSGSAATIYGLTTLFWALIVLGIGAAAVYKAFD
jgi:hypothetical protein